MDSLAEKLKCILMSVHTAIALRAVANAGIRDSDIRDMMLEAVEKHFGSIRAQQPVEWLSDNGSSCRL